MLCNYQSLYSRPLRHKIHTPVHTTDELVRLTYHDIQHSGGKKQRCIFGEISILQISELRNNIKYYQI